MLISKRNIISLYFIKMSKWFMLYMPIIVLFYQDNGLSVKDVLTLQSIYSVAIIILEIPSGYLADVLGKRNTIIWGTFFGVIGFGIYSLSSGFLAFLIAELTLGVGQSLISGSDSAILYDSLKYDKKDSLYVKYEGRILSIGNFSETIAAVLGGFLAHYSLRAPFYCQVIIATIAIPAAFFLCEPYKNSSNKPTSIKHILSVVNHSLFKSRELSLNIIFSAIIGCATLTMAWVLQAYLNKTHNFSEYQIGIAWSIVNLTVGIVTLFAHKIENFLGLKNLLILICSIIGLTFIMVGITENSIVFLIIWIFYMARGVATPVLKNCIIILSEPEVRATILSIRNFVIRIFFACIAPFIGWITDKYSIRMAFLLLGISVLISGGMILSIYLPFLEKYSNKFILTQIESNNKFPKQ